MSLIATSQFTYSNEGTSNITEAFDGAEYDVTKFYYSNSALFLSYYTHVCRDKKALKFSNVCLTSLQLKKE